MLPSAVTARVSIEAAIAQPWWRWLGAHGRPVSLEHYGASADATTLYREFGITADAAVAAAKTIPRRSISAAAERPLHHDSSEGIDRHAHTQSRSALADLAAPGYPCGWTTCPGSDCSPGTCRT